ncbi:GroES-like protein [Astrocystis sublimbata]|nr:GroES-like protein [Astrocystis sublimbata]
MAYIQRRALVTSAGMGLELLERTELFDLEPDNIACRVFAVALNPGDGKSSDYTASRGSVAGFDFAGEVLEVGSGVTRFKGGDRIAGFAFGYNPDDRSTGAFADIVIAVESLTLLLPPQWSFEEGATLGTAICTVGFALAHYLDISLPREAEGVVGHHNRGEHILVSGGATATGMVATQILSLAGFQVVVTCSPSSAALVKSLGAIATFDYQSPSCGAEVRAFTGDDLVRVLDCVTSADTMGMCYTAISSRGGRYIGLNPISAHVKYTRRDVTADWVMALAMFGLPVRLGGDFGRPAMPTLRGLGMQIFRAAEDLLARDQLKAPRLQIRAGGLPAVLEGIEDLKMGRAEGVKLVYTVQ